MKSIVLLLSLVAHTVGFFSGCASPSARAPAAPRVLRVITTPAEAHLRLESIHWNGAKLETSTLSEGDTNEKKLEFNLTGGDRDTLTIYATAPGFDQVSEEVSQYAWDNNTKEVTVYLRESLEAKMARLQRERVAYVENRSIEEPIKSAILTGELKEGMTKDDASAALGGISIVDISDGVGGQTATYRHNDLASTTLLFFRNGILVRWNQRINL